MSVEHLIESWLPVIATLVIFSLLIWLANWLLFTRFKSPGNENTFARQLMMLLLTLVTVVAVVITLPISESTETQVLSLIGLVLSGLLAFSSTTIFSNLMAGAMMRFTQPFRTGDFIRVKEHFGRVTERGVFDCEVQTENRELIAIPNSLLITNSITVIRSSGTIVSVSLSLGYDIHHSKIETLLIQAAEQVGLEDPFVHITELGNFSVTYKISGLLLDVKNLLTTRSKLYSHVLDCLHDSDIEIMSPTFVSQHAGPDVERKIAPSPKIRKSEDKIVAEDIVFDKAERAEQQEKAKTELVGQLAELKQQHADAEKEQKTALEGQIKQLEEEINHLKKPSNEEEEQ
ncbi:mechanosensitive ion channel domain-containing protein [Neptunicella sp. SCSIO 80796]|uniref:mechanosensitive ion channel domain-containing protein n=1 Tax=Neptunicella plasticusilytica TaxID=3117012 RepID=UPI003A4E0471